MTRMVLSAVAVFLLGGYSPVVAQTPEDNAKAAKKTAEDEVARTYGFWTDFTQPAKKTTENYGAAQRGRYDFWETDLQNNMTFMEYYSTVIYLDLGDSLVSDAYDLLIEAYSAYSYAMTQWDAGVSAMGDSAWALAIGYFEECTEVQEQAADLYGAAWLKYNQAYNNYSYADGLMDLHVPD